MAGRNDGTNGTGKGSPDQKNQNYFGKIKNHFYRNGNTYADFLATAYGTYLIVDGIASKLPLEAATGAGILAYFSVNYRNKRADKRKIRQLEKKVEEADTLKKTVKELKIEKKEDKKYTERLETKLAGKSQKKK